MNIPTEFIQRTEQFLGEETKQLLHALENPLRPSIRLNRNKNTHKLNLDTKVAWCNNAYYLNSKPIFTLDPYFHAGHYYVQEAASMFLYHIVNNLEIPKNATVLDLCAAPGGKSTLLIDTFSDEAVIHSHEVNKARAEILRQNIEKWGNPNSIITTGPIYKFAKFNSLYDLILIDAPCSGEGMFRKEKDAIKQWSLSKINTCKNIQLELIQQAYQMLRPGGYMIYSTCTYNTEENEQVVNQLVNTHPEIIILSDRFNEFNLFKIKAEINSCYRFLPHRMEGEGFTFSILQKPGLSAKALTTEKIKLIQSVENKFKNLINYSYASEIIDSPWGKLLLPKTLKDLYYLLLENRIEILHTGIPIGQYKGTDWFPAHGLTQSTYLNNNLTKLTLELPQALQYLRADSNNLPTPESSETWQLVTYEDSILGWVKNINGKLKNYYPKNQRIHSL